MNASHARIRTDTRASANADLAAFLEVEKIMRHLQAGRDLADSDDPTLPEIVWALIRDAALTFRAMPDRERAWLAAGERIQWPSIVHDASELAEAFATQVARVQAGEEPVESLQVKPPRPGAAAIDRAYDVLHWRRYLVGSKTRRDWKILFLIGVGIKEANIARECHCSRQAIHDRKRLQTAAIARALDALIRRAAS